MSKMIWVGVAILGAFLLIGGTGAIVSTVKDRAFEARETAREQERQQFEREAQAHRDEQQKAIKEAEDLKAQIKVLEAASVAAGQRAEDAREKAEQYDREFVEEMERIGMPVDSCLRLQRVCARLKLKPEDCKCE